MKSMVILTDFSEAAFRAAEYACELAGCLNIKRIILFHSYQPVVVVAGTPAGTIGSYDQETYLESMRSLAMLQDRLKPIAGQDVTFDLATETTGPGGMIDLINERSKKEEIDMVVMGVSDKSGLERFLLGSTTTEAVNNSKQPIMIVPEDTLLGKGIKTIVLTVDLEQVDTLPTQKLFEFLDAFPAKIQVVNVDTKAKEKYSPQMEKSISRLHELLGKYNPLFNYITGDDIVEEVLDFSRNHRASLIIAVHQTHGFLSNLFHKSITKQLAYNSTVPLLSLPGLKNT
jgi:nucleotide-binding universal stress UspA family protein